MIFKSLINLLPLLGQSAFANLVLHFHSIPVCVRQDMKFMLREPFQTGAVRPHASSPNKQELCDELAVAHAERIV